MNDDVSSDAMRPGAILSWLKLMRLPTVFTALSNILCGFFVSSSEYHLPTIVGQPEFWLLLLSSAGLYLGGMVLNDVFDAELDSRERPNRPIPSGAVSKSAAAVFGATLMMIGVGAAALASQMVEASAAVQIAVFLAAAVVLYDALLKNTMAAPLGMGVCRFLNIMLGASCCGSWQQVWTGDHVMVAAALGIYVVGVTWFAQNEAGQSSRASLLRGLTVVMAGLAMNVNTAWQQTDVRLAATGALIALGLIAANICLRGARAVKANQSILLQKTVGFMLLNIIFMDAAMAFCFTGNGRLATLIVILVIPATLMKRVIPLS